MTTKYNTGDEVLIPARIAGAESRNGTITYSVEAETWAIPEESIEPNTNAIGMGYAALLDAIDSRREY